MGKIKQTFAAIKKRFGKESSKTQVLPRPLPTVEILPPPVSGRRRALLRRRAVTIAVVAFLLICSGVALVLILRGTAQDIFLPGQREMRVYFFNSSAGVLVAEHLPISSLDFIFTAPQEYDLNWVAAALANMQRPPARGLSTTWPETAVIADYMLDRRVLTIVLNESYSELPALDEALFRTALTLTLTAGPYIDEVKLRLGEQEWTESRSTVSNTPEFSPARLINAPMLLYFVCESGEGLVRGYYTAMGVNPRELERAALERLIHGPGMAGTVSFIPPETRVRVLHYNETRSVYVLLSGEFSTRFNGTSTQAQLMIAAIVNTVLSNPSAGAGDLRHVFFLIDSARESQFHGVADFDRGFEYDETVMVWYVPEEEYES